MDGVVIWLKLWGWRLATGSLVVQFDVTTLEKVLLVATSRLGGGGVHVDLI